MRRLTVCAIGLTLVLGACAGQDKPGANRPSSVVEVAITSPAPGEKVDADKFTVAIELEGGEIVDETTKDITPTTEGHVHVSIDGNIKSQTFGLKEKLDTPPPGRHILQVEFVAKDHGPFDPRIIQSVPFEVTE